MHVAAVFVELLKDPAAERYGEEFALACNMLPGSLRPILTRLQDRGLLEFRQEEGDVRELRRALRRYFRLTPEGVEFGRAYVPTVRLPVVLPLPSLE